MASYRSTGAGEPRVVEAPDVILYAGALERLSGLAVRAISLGPKCPSVLNIDAVILPSTLRSAGCHGRLLWLDIDERILIVNVGQHVRITLAQPDVRYVALRLDMVDGKSVYVSDRRRFVTSRIVDPSEVRRMIAVMGPSVMDVDGDRDPTDIINRACSVERSIAEALHDPTVIAGIGQRIASEALLAAGVSPWRPVSQVHRSEWRALLTAAHVEAHRALSIGLMASTHEAMPTLAWQLPTVSYGRTHLADGTRLIREQCVSGWSLTWAPGVQR